MLILTTSNPGELDEAVLDRMDEIIQLPMPSEKERRSLLLNQFYRNFKQDETGSNQSAVQRLLSRMSNSTSARFDVDFDVDARVEDLAKDFKTDGFSGRELEKIIRGVLVKTHASDGGVLTTALWEKETEIMIKSIKSKHALLN